jgi:hypothetical protein
MKKKKRRRRRSRKGGREEPQTIFEIQHQKHKQLKEQ